MYKKECMKFHTKKGVLNMKKNFLVLVTLALAFVFIFVACDNGTQNGTQAVEVKNWSDQYTGAAPTFSSQPSPESNRYARTEFSLTGTSASVINGTSLQIVYKLEGKNGFFNNDVASVSYDLANDIYKCFPQTDLGDLLASFESGEHTIRVGIPYETGGARKYTWSDTFVVTKSW
jgi:hypothetical protein